MESKENLFLACRILLNSSDLEAKVQSYKLKESMIYIVTSRVDPVDHWINGSVDQYRVDQCVKSRFLYSYLSWPKRSINYLTHKLARSTG